MPIACEIRNNNAKIAVLADQILEREDSDFYEALWLEVERIASSRAPAGKDEREDMTIAHVMRRVAKQMATKQFEEQ